jgi:hypothetical protein
MTRPSAASGEAGLPDAPTPLLAGSLPFVQSLTAPLSRRTFFSLRPMCSIDGSVLPKQKHALTTQFQEDPSVQVAVVGITAAGVGLTFTAAHVGVFAELHWTPGMLFQVPACSSDGATEGMRRGGAVIGALSTLPRTF